MSPEATDQTEITRSSTADHVAQLLREMIWAGELESHTRLKEVPLATRFGVSRPTLREAIRQLETEGLVRHELHHGAVVTALTPDDIADIYRVRRILELNAVRKPPSDAESLRPLKTAVEAMERGIESDDYRALVEADRDFHAALVGLMGSPRVDKLFAQIGAEIRLAVGILSLEDERSRSPNGSRANASELEIEDHEEVVAEHRIIYERIAAGRDVQHLLEAHLDRGESRVLAILAERESGDA